MTAGTENVERTAIAVEDRFLGFVHDELRAELDLGTPLRGEPERDLLARRVVVLQNLEELAHRPPPVAFGREKTTRVLTIMLAEEY